MKKTLLMGGITLALLPYTLQAQTATSQTSVDNILTTSAAHESSATHSITPQEECSQQALNQLLDSTWHYKANYDGIHADAVRRIEATDDQTIHATTESSWLFIRLTEESQFQWPSWQLMEYRYARQGLSNKKDYTITPSNHANEFISDSPTRGQRKLTTTEPVYDQLSHQIRLQIDVACNANQNTFEYAIAKRRGVKHYQYERLGNEEIKVNGKTYSTVKLEKKNNGEEKTQIWLAPELAYGIVKLAYIEDGDANYMELSEIKLPQSNVENTHLDGIN
ncbi:DUF3108 domain-containing protein [Marinibactrum halimedae]|uniref:DUF3108 domain-containing protein n=1 Tax=Marinibactrum halimedae TaxID=1444977 RepID=A0AA37WME8_9GAMM|nr:DUF3108 domain-containing protein [Marinibactrum halimedae]MCD9457691.1 DUF3108 domain-containing protein [Marinibactrum halimedae]GLS24936.1 hypothetical protein GCM10007877_06500 [Marinibactrum halimedae]